MPAERTVPTTSGPLNATVVVPGSKSITNRALLLAGLAAGSSVIDNALFSDDTRYLATALRQLGITVIEDEPAQRITVTGAGGPLPGRDGDLFIGNSGTTMRFLVAALTLGEGRFRVDGVPRMRERPIGPLLDALSQFGASVTGELRDGYPPVLVNASGLPGGVARIRGDLSSQYISALMMAGPLTEHGITLDIEGNLVSRPYLELTARVMKQFGASVGIDGRRITVAGGQTYRGTTFAVEPDASSASYFFAAAALTGGRVEIQGLPASSAQGDVHFVDALEAMGCRVERSAESITVTGPGQLAGIEADFGDISDTAMTLAALAPFASEPVTITNIANIRVKESDRIAAMATELRKLGVEVEERPDGWRIVPGEPHAGLVATYDDHRIAMSFAILGLRTPGVVIQDPGCVAKTFPDFFDRLDALVSA